MNYDERIASAEYLLSIIRELFHGKFVFENGMLACRSRKNPKKKYKGSVLFNSRTETWVAGWVSESDCCQLDLSDETQIKETLIKYLSEAYCLRKPKKIK